MFSLIIVYIYEGYLPTLLLSINLYFSFSFIFIFISFITIYFAFALRVIWTQHSFQSICLCCLIWNSWEHFFCLYRYLYIKKRWQVLIPAILLLLICIKPYMTSCWFYFTFTALCDITLRNTCTSFSFTSWLPPHY